MLYLHTSRSAWTVSRCLPKEYAVLSISTPRTAYSVACAHLRTGKSIIFANCSCRSSDQDVNCGTISLPISFPTEWLIPSDSTAFLAEKEKITDIQMIVKISQIIPVFFSSSCFLSYFSCLFDSLLCLGYLTPDFMPADLRTDLFDIRHLRSILQMTLLQQVYLLYK